MTECQLFIHRPDDSSTKPLPSLPTTLSAQIHSLSNADRSHLQRVIASCIDAEDLSPRHVWRRSIEAATDQMATAIQAKDWLRGLRDMKHRRVEKLQQEEREQRELMEKKRSNGKEKDKDKDKPKAPGSGDQRSRTLSTAPSLVGEHAVKALQQLKALSTLPPSRTSKITPLTPYHLLLTLRLSASSRMYGRNTDNLSFRHLHRNENILFEPSTFSLPPTPFEDIQQGIILFGLNEWDPDAPPPKDASLRLAGGTFVLKSAFAPSMQAVANVLRVAVYTRLSMICEQFLMNDLGLREQLKFPEQRKGSVPLTHFQTLPGNTQLHTPLHSPTKKDHNKAVNRGLWSFISNKADRLRKRLEGSQHEEDGTDQDQDPLHRSASIEGVSLFRTTSMTPMPPNRERQSMDVNPSTRGSLDIPDSASVDLSSENEHERTQGDSAPTTVDSKQFPYQYILTRLKSEKDSLTSSPEVVFSVPSLIEKLAAKESVNSNRRPRGDERIGLDQLLGWDGRESRGRGMVGVTGFVRHQAITVLCLSTVPGTADANQNGKSDGKGDGAISALERLVVGRTTCSKEHLLTYRYFSSVDEEDISLGGYIELVCRSAGESCEKTIDCEHTVGQHRWEWIHGGYKVEGRFSPHPRVNELQGILTWRKCTVCNCQTEPVSLDDAAYLMSFGKFLELVIYSSRFSKAPHGKNKMCEHIEKDPLFATIWFAVAEHSVQFSVHKTGTVYDIELPRLQVGRGDKNVAPKRRMSVDSMQRGSDAAKSRTEGSQVSVPSHSDLDILRKEIEDWWSDFERHMQLVSEYLDLRAANVSEETLSHDSSVSTGGETDNDTETETETDTETEAETESRDSDPATPRPKHLRLLSSETAVPDHSPRHSASETVDDDEVHYHTRSNLFEKLRQHLLHKKKAVLHLLNVTPPSRLNDVRYRFKSDARASKKRLEAWQTKHIHREGLPESTNFPPNSVLAKEPEWWGKTCHTVPGSRYIAIEGDWGSVIASTLGSSEYVSELSRLSSPSSRATSMSTNKTSTLPTVLQGGSEPSSASVTPSVSASASTISLFMPATGNTSSPQLKGGKELKHKTSLNPDEDLDHSSWDISEPYTTLVTRRDHPRELSSTLGILSSPRRASEHLPKGSDTNSSTSRFMGLSPAVSRFASGKGSSILNVARGKPAVQTSREEAGGQTHIDEKWKQAVTANAEKLLAQSKVSDHLNVPSSPVIQKSLSDGSGARHMGNGSVIVTSISRSDSASLTEQSRPAASISDVLDLPPPVPPKGNPIQTIDEKEAVPATPPPSEITASATPSFTKLIRSFLLAETPVIPDDHLVQGTSSKKHSLLAVTDPHLNFIDPKPHVKLEWTVGTRLKFSCTVYYAQQFDSLRRQCGCDAVLPGSLATNMDWAAEGGKSKASFWKTGDERFIIKTLVNSWNVADLQVLIDLSPAYFRYMDCTATRASVLAKLMGFYSVEMSNLTTGETKVVHLLIMENLFFDHPVVKTFDLKGIQGRKVKPKGSGTKEKGMLFDSEWVEGQKKTLTLVSAHSKYILQQAIKFDAEFLTKNLIMDYSLLLGVDEDNQQLVCGLIDTIGSFSLAKTLEWRLKQGIINASASSATKEVTILPPQAYHDRFVSALEGYFLACPDKWTKPVGGVYHYSVEDLPSVF